MLPKKKRITLATAAVRLRRPSAIGCPISRAHLTDIQCHLGVNFIILPHLIFDLGNPIQQHNPNLGSI